MFTTNLIYSEKRRSSNLLMIFYDIFKKKKDRLSGPSRLLKVGGFGEVL